VDTIVENLLKEVTELETEMRKLKEKITGSSDIHTGYKYLDSATSQEIELFESMRTKRTSLIMKIRRRKLQVEKDKEDSDRFWNNVCYGLGCIEGLISCLFSSPEPQPQPRRYQKKKVVIYYN
jgi:predicted mannosyl-3-phosphoglycerate phosphatase (HAD superfamily)